VIQPGDAIQLAPGVELRDGALTDEVSGISIPLNRSAQIVLGAPTIAAAGEALGEQGAPDGVRDALDFCIDLNARFMLNVRIALRERVRRRLAALLYGIVLHAPVHRTDAPRTRDVVRELTVPAALLTLALAPAAVLAGVVALSGAFVTGLGIVLHEVGHALALRGTPRALVMDGLRPMFLHRRLVGLRALAVAVAGPLAPSLVALAIAVLWRAGAPAAAPLAAHAFGLTTLAEDGRNACGLS
jgi:hypothetical protein